MKKRVWLVQMIEFNSVIRRFFCYLLLFCMALCVHPPLVFMSNYIHVQDRAVRVSFRGGNAEHFAPGSAIDSTGGSGIQRATPEKEILVKELKQLQRTVIEKIQHDVDATAEAFLWAKQKSGWLFWARIFGPILTFAEKALTAFNKIVTLTSAESLPGKVQEAIQRSQNPIEVVSTLMAIHQLKEAGRKFKAAITGPKYNALVKDMLEEADRTLALLSSDYDGYKNVIKNRINSSFESPVGIPHKASNVSRETVEIVWGTSVMEAEIRRRFRRLINELEVKVLPQDQVSHLISEIGRIRSDIAKSQNRSREINYTTYLKSDGQYEPQKVSVRLGTIGELRRLQGEEFGRFAQDLKIEQIMVFKTSVELGIEVTILYTSSATGKVIAEVKKGFIIPSAINLSNRILFPSNAEEQIDMIPQEMLMTLPTEFSNLWIIVDDVINHISYLLQAPQQINPIPTILLVDTSGSMANNNKIEQARAAALDALSEIRASVRKGAATPPVAVLTFAGSCSPTNTRKLIDFTTNLDQVERVLRYRLPRPGGGTPSPQAVDVSINEMKAFLSRYGKATEGRIILLSDGQSTCGRVRPPGIYSKRWDIPVGRGPSQFVSGQGQSHITFLTIGFDVQPGSEAERDLQYLASISGGKYFNAPDRRQLARTFQKFVRVFIPKDLALVRITVSSTLADFERGRQAMFQRDYQTALQSFRSFVAAEPDNPAGLYNLAQALEATDHYKGAAEYYSRYLAVNPSAPDRTEVERRILQMRQDYVDQFNYYLEILRSDLAYLKNYYQSLFHRRNEELAKEFGGFVNEKAEFYAKLADILEVREQWLQAGGRALSDSLYTLADRVGWPTFDRDAVSLLTIPIAQLEELIERLAEYQARFVH